MLIISEFAGLQKNFNQWDPLIDGRDEDLIEGTNITVLHSAIWPASNIAGSTDLLSPPWYLAAGGTKISSHAFVDILDYYGKVEESLPHQQTKHSVDFFVFCYQLFSRDVLDSNTCLSASSSLWLQCDYEEAWNENQEGSFVELVKTLQGCIRIPCAMTRLSILCRNTTVFYFLTQIAIKLLCVQIRCQFMVCSFEVLNAHS